MRARKVLTTAAIGLLGLLLLWFPITWFVFGSVHPCGILTQRMARREAAYASQEASIENGRRLNDFLLTGGEVPHHIDLKDREAEPIRKLRRDTYLLPPATCLRRAITWRWNSKEDEFYQSRWEDARLENERWQQRMDQNKELRKEFLRKLEGQRQPKK